MTLQAGARGDPAAEQIGDDAEELVEEEQERDGDVAVSEPVEMQNDQHAQRAVGEGKAPVGSGHQRIVAYVCSRQSRLSGSLEADAATFARKLDQPVHIAPFVVVPGEDFHLRAVDDHGRRAIDDGGARIVEEVDRDQRTRFKTENASQAPSAASSADY